MNGLTTDGTRSQIVRMNLFAGSNLAACITPIVHDKGDPSDTNHNFAGGDYSEATGLQGDAATKYLATGVDMTTAGITNNGAMLAAYVTANRADNAWPILAADDGSNVFELFPFYAAAIIAPIFGGPGQLYCPPITDPLGFTMATRVSAADGRGFRNGTQVGSTQSTAGGDTVSASIEVFRNAHTANYSGDLCAGYAIGIGFTPTQASNFYTRIQAFQTALGRNV